MADEPKRIPEAQEAIRKRMEAGGAVSQSNATHQHTQQTTPAPAKPKLPIEERAEQIRSGGVSQLLVRAQDLASEIEYALFGSSEPVAAETSVIQRLHEHITRLYRVRDRL